MRESYRIAAVVNEDLGKGFSLTGVEVLEASDGERALEILREEIRKRAYGLIIVEEGLLEGIDERERTALFERTIPLIIAIPGAMRWRDVEETTSDEFVARLIRRAVGYQLNIQI